MAVAPDQVPLGTATEGPSNQSQITNTGKPIAANATILVALGSFTTGAAGTHTVSGGSLSWSKDKDNASGNNRVSLWRADTASAISAGALTITGSVTGTSDVLMGAVSVTGLTAGAGAVRTSNGGSGSSNSATGGSLTATSGDWLFSAFFEDGNGSLTANPSPATEAFDFSSAGQSEAMAGAYKTATGTDSITFALSASVGWVCSAVAYIPAAGGGGEQTVNPGAIASGSTVRAATVTPGAVTVSAGAISAGSQLFAPTLSPGAVTVSPGAIGSTSQLFAPSLNGTSTVSPDAIASTGQLFAPTVSSSFTLEPGVIASGVTVRAPTVTPGAVTVSPSHIAASTLVYGPDVSGGDVQQAVAQAVPTIPTIPEIPSRD